VQTQNDDDYVLVIEDDPHTSAAYRAILEAEGYRVVRARGGFEALCRLEAGPGAPRLIVLDLDMPGIDGLEFHRQKRKRPAHAAVPVIVVSGSDRAATHPDGDDVKARMAKPLDVPSFLAEVAVWARAPG